MSRTRRAALLLAVLTVCGTVRVPAQEPPPVPEPYTREEFSDSMQALRRAEIVTVGAFPFTLLFAILVYDYARWAGGGFAAETAPFRRPPGEDPFSDDEKVGIAIGALGAAVAVAAADYLLGRAEAGQAPAVEPPPEPPEQAVRPPDAPIPHAGVLPVSLATVMAPAAGRP
ncbi:MAG: hypothetical protein OXC12_03725 [Spirochaetaceae bacterium]|nr:hypothetical protein [Spirochaetaceae bacterium]